jgi:hypothetical protein
MEACRALLNVPDDEVLYEAIKELQQQVAAEREKRNAAEMNRTALELIEYKLKDELAAEREKVKALSEALKLAQSNHE